MPALSRVGTAFFLNKPGGGAGGGAAAGEAVFHADNWTQLLTWNAQTTYSWTVPEGVTSISVICVGGGGGGQPEHDGASGAGGALAYKNNIPVTPGEDINVYVGGGGFEQNWGGSYGMEGKDSKIEYNGTVYAQAGGGSRADKNQANGYVDNSVNGVRGGDYDGGGDGANGCAWSGCRQSGGGAGGYNGGGLSVDGTPGNPQYSGWTPKKGAHGGGGGGCSSNGASSFYSAGGGGTGIYGKGTDGTAAANANTPGNEYEFCGKGGSYDPWAGETNGLTVNSYVHTTGLRGYSNNSSESDYANPGSSTPNGNNNNGTDLMLGSGADRRYLRAYSPLTQGQGSHSRPDGGFPGGGGGGGHSGSPAGAGGNGVVRIVWGTINGMTREFPNQGVNKTDEYPGLGGNTPTKYGTQRMC